MCPSTLFPTCHHYSFHLQCIKCILILPHTGSNASRFFITTSFVVIQRCDQPTPVAFSVLGLNSPSFPRSKRVTRWSHPFILPSLPSYFLSVAGSLEVQYHPFVPLSRHSFHTHSWHVHRTLASSHSIPFHNNPDSGPRHTLISFFHFYFSVVVYFRSKFFSTPLPLLSNRSFHSYKIPLYLKDGTPLL